MLSEGLHEVSPLVLEQGRKKGREGEKEGEGKEERGKEAEFESFEIIARHLLCASSWRYADTRQRLALPSWGFQLARGGRHWNYGRL